MEGVEDLIDDPNLLVTPDSGRHRLTVLLEREEVRLVDAIETALRKIPR